MDKEKILSLAREKKEDERYINISVKGTLISIFITMFVVLFILLFKALNSYNVSDMGLVLISQVIGFSVYQYIRMPERKIYLVITAFGFVFLIVILIVFVVSFGG